MRIRFLLLVAALGAAACGGSTPTQPLAELACVPLGGIIESRIAPSCAGCAVNLPDDAADGDFATYATMEAPAMALGEVELRATGGQRLPAGTVAAVVGYVEYTASVRAGGRVLVRTYLDGQLQEEMDAEPDPAPVQVDGTGRLGDRFLLAAGRDFDGIGFALEADAASGLAAGIYEFCTQAPGGEPN